MNSKELEALNDLIEDLLQDNGVSIICKEKVEKSLKALEIIKEKDVDVCELKIYIDEYDDSLYQYNKRMNIKRFKLTEEEFNLLKEVLE